MRLGSRSRVEHLLLERTARDERVAAGREREPLCELGTRCAASRFLHSRERRSISALRGFVCADCSG